MFIHVGLLLLIPYISSEQLVRKSLYVNYLLLYMPIVTFLISFVYGVIFDFKICYPLYVFLPFPLTILVWEQWFLLYQIADTFLR